MPPVKRPQVLPPPPSAIRQPKRARVSLPTEESRQVNTLGAYRIPLADADVFYVDGFAAPDVANGWFEELKEIEGWYQPTLKMYGKEILQSRKIAAFATDPELVVKYSGQIVQMQYEYPKVLRDIQSRVEKLLGVTFNHCMLNLYENGTVYIGNHRDNRENRVIASLSLGAKRTFVMTHDSPPSLKTKTGLPSEDGLLYKKRWELANGSLVVMQGATQQKWKHEIPKEPKLKDGRISLTFRQLVF
ncbi:hypothetical protein P7C70_g8152, partial [Phenoliferia sp. Uapishka_3]